VGGELDVAVGALSATCTLRTPPAIYRCLATVTGNEPTGAQLVTVRVRDAAGNETFAGSQVVFDFEGPRVVPGSEGVSIAAPSGAALLVVDAATVGATARVSLALDEAVGVPPVLRFVASPTRTFALVGGVGAAFAFEQALVGVLGLEDGDAAVELLATDPVGNSTTSTLTVAVPIDRASPAPAAVDVSGAVTLRRAPNGDESASTPSISVVGGAGAVEADATVLVLDGAAGRELGRSVAGADGAFAAITLPPFDVTEVFVVVVDNAANESTSRRVRDGLFVASLGGKVAGSTRDNPHVLFAVDRFEERLHHPGAIEPAEAARAGAADGLATTVTSRGSWRDVTPGSGGPSNRQETAFVWDEARGQGVLFGGASPLQDDTWAWDGVRWSAVAVAGARPSPRSRHAMAYDSWRQQVVLLGGTDTTGDRNDTWTFDGTRWRELSPSTSPVDDGDRPRIAEHQLAFDAERGVVVAFGGSIPANTVWEWNGTTWARIRPSTSPPARRRGHSLTYDPVRRVVVLYGGTDSVTVRDDLWTWDGATWRDITPTTQRPPPRTSHGATWDDARSAIVVGGGSTDPLNVFGTFLDDVWSFDGVAWSIVRQGAFVPRTDGVMAFDPIRRDLLFIGGRFNGASAVDPMDVFAVEPTAVARLAPKLQPSADREYTLATDDSRARVVLYGGSGSRNCSIGSTICDETWEWSGRTWDQVCTDAACRASRPPRRVRHSAAWDERRGVVVVFGGDVFEGPTRRSVDETWEFDGALWRLVVPTTSPPGRSSHRLAYDSVSERVVLFGGINANTLALFSDTWTYDGATWTQVTPGSGPSARQLHGLSADGSGVLLAGGVDTAGAKDETWRFDGVTRTWGQLTPTTSFGANRNFALAFDRDTQTHVMFAGNNRDTTFIFDGSAWDNVTPQTRPPSREGTSLAYLEPTGEAIVLTNAQTWAWSGGARARLAHVLHVDLAATGVASAGGALVDVSSRWQGTVSGTNVGATLVQWDRGRWRALDAGAADVETLSASLPPAALNAVSSAPVLGLAVATDGVGEQGASLTSDLLLVEVRYRLP